MSKIKLPLLAIETSGELCSAALLIGENILYEYSIRQKNIHSEKLFEMIQNVLSSAKITINEIGAIAYSSGPGSFTGLRIGLSAAKGIAFGISKPVIPVPTFDALAYAIAKYHKIGTKFRIVRNASKDEIYSAHYIINEKLEYDNVELLNKNEITFENDNLVYGDSKIDILVKNVIGPSASNIAEWAYLFGEDLLTFDYDYLEPNYLKKFIVKVKK